MRFPFSLSLSLLSFFLSTYEIRAGRWPRSFDQAKIDPEVLLVNSHIRVSHRYVLPGETRKRAGARVDRQLPPSERSIALIEADDT